MRKGWRCVGVWKGYVCMCISRFGCMLGEGWGGECSGRLGAGGRGGRGLGDVIYYGGVCVWVSVGLACMWYYLCVCVGMHICGIVWWWDLFTFSSASPCSIVMVAALLCLQLLAAVRPTMAWCLGTGRILWNLCWMLRSSTPSFTTVATHSGNAGQVSYSQGITYSQSCKTGIVVCSDHLLLKSWHTQVMQDVQIIYCQSHDILRVNLDTDHLPSKSWHTQVMLNTQKSAVKVTTHSGKNSSCSDHLLSESWPTQVMLYAQIVCSQSCNTGNAWCSDYQLWKSWL